MRRHVARSILGGFLGGVLFTTAIALLVGYLTVRAGALPANADAKPPPIERWIARTSLRAAIHREAPRAANPVPATDANLVAGMHSYVANCAVCHGVADAKETNIAAGLYQRPPQLAGHGVEDDPDGVTFWKIYHGIRFTGMPSYAGTLNTQEIWQIIAFLSRMDRLPTNVAGQWNRARIREAIAPAASQREEHGPPFQR
jgi:mono/diheme cytochrome c family protein